MEQPARAYSQVAAQCARDDLIVQHLWLVRHIARRLLAQLPPGVDLDNLESAGVLGLVEAATRFDPDRGVSFRAYSSIRIRGAILDELRRNCPLPQELLQNIALVQKARQVLTPPIGVGDLAKETGLSQNRVIDCLTAIPLTRVKSLDQIGESWFHSSTDAPDAAIQREDQKKLLAKAIQSLSERERLTVTLYYTEDLRLKEIGHVLKLSESRISRLLTAAQFHLREYVRARV